MTRGAASKKGLLQLEDEIAAPCAVASASGAGAHVGMSVNWAQSALKTRNASRALEHIAAAGAAGLLRGFMLSSCDATGSGYGTWLDLHVPFEDCRWIISYAHASRRECAHGSACARERRRLSLLLRLLPSV